MDPLLLVVVVVGAGLFGALSWALRKKPANRPPRPARRQVPRRNNTFRDVRDDGSDDPLISNDFDSDSDDTLADRLERAADRFENAGDHAKAQQARDAAANLDSGVSDAATTLAVADLLDAGGASGSDAVSDAADTSDAGSSSFSDNS